MPIRAKFAIALTAGLAWAALSVWLSLQWLDDLSGLLGPPLALFVIAFIAYVPGFMNVFLIASILMDRRPERRHLDRYPGISILVACYNEEASIAATIGSLATQGYSGATQVLILDDGSTDGSLAAAEAAIAGAAFKHGHAIEVVRGGRNIGKAGVLNRGLALCTHDIVITLDGDSWVYDDAIQRLVERYIADPPNTRAVAGAVLVRNSRGGQADAEHVPRDAGGPRGVFVGHYYLAAVMTLLVLPLAALWNGFIYRVQHTMFKRQDLKVRRNLRGFFMYVLGYSMILQPICVWGYVSELLGLRKHWGTK